MSNTTPHAPALNGVPHLGRAEAVLYLILFYIFGHIHPRYRRYIDAVAQHERLGQICERADTLTAIGTRRTLAMPLCPHAPPRSGKRQTCPISISRCSLLGVS